MMLSFEIYSQIIFYTISSQTTCIASERSISQMWISLHSLFRCTNARNCVTCAMLKRISQSTSNYLVVVNNKFKLPYSIDSNDIESIYVYVCVKSKKKSKKMKKNSVRWKISGWQVRAKLFVYVRFTMQTTDQKKHAHMAKDYSTSTVLYT